MGRGFGLFVGRGGFSVGRSSGPRAWDRPARHVGRRGAVLGGRGSCRDFHEAVSAMASESAFHAEAWAAAVLLHHGRDAHRNSEQGRGPDAAEGQPFRAGALENEGRGMGRGGKGRQLHEGASGRGGRAGLPSSLTVCRGDPKGKQSLAQEAAGAGLLGRLVFHAIAVSSDDDRLPVMHQPVDHGAGQGVVHVEDRAPLPEGLVRRDDDRA